MRLRLSTYNLNFEPEGIRVVFKGVTLTAVTVKARSAERLADMNYMSTRHQKIYIVDDGLLLDSRL
jgi:hypothetical protein